MVLRGPARVSAFLGGLCLFGAWQRAWVLQTPLARKAIQRKATSGQTLPALSELEEYTGKVYNVRSETDMKSLADHVVREAAQGLATDSLGVKAASVIVKACATAMTLDFDGQIVAMALDWVTKKPHGRALREGAMEVTALRTHFQLVANRPIPKQVPLLVGRNTNVGQLGGAILGRIQQAGEAVIHVAGPERTMSALRAVVAADRLWSVDERNSEASGGSHRSRVLVSASWQSDAPGKAYLRPAVPVGAAWAKAATCDERFRTDFRRWQKKSVPAAGCSLLKHFAVKRKHEEDAKSKASAASAASAASVNGSEEKVKAKQLKFTKRLPKAKAASKAPQPSVNPGVATPQRGGVAREEVQRDVQGMSSPPSKGVPAAEDA
ncbi:RPS16A [Symbiodinium natans]|uniref:RPS16A protein n=1 Tax=Symbiodinium natans TaxID=878477 RepID=A0A812N9F8_9DINO|nr:RPS16A [Symbiodinium natans]